MSPRAAGRAIIFTQSTTNTVAQKKVKKAFEAGGCHIGAKDKHVSWKAGNGDFQTVDAFLLPESLLPEMVSADHIRREQQRDEFAKELLRRLQESGQEYVERVEGTAPRSGAKLRIAKFAELDGLLFRITEASDPREGFDRQQRAVPAHGERPALSAAHYMPTVGGNRAGFKPPQLYCSSIRARTG